MEFLISDAMAQAGGGAGASPWTNIIMLLLFVAIFYFLLIRPQMKRQKEHKAMVESMTKGDEVVTSGGVLGKVTDIGEAFLTLEIADNIQVKVQRHAVSAVMPKGTIKSS